MTPYVCSGPLYISATDFDDDATRYDDVPETNKFVGAIQTCCGGYANVILATSITRLEHGKSYQE